MPFGRLLRRYPSWYLGVSLLALFSLYYVYNYMTVINETQSVNLKYLLAAAIRAAEEGGLQVFRHSQTFNLKSKGKTDEGAEQYVTEADFKSHCVMYQFLNDIFPSVEIISEESGANEKCPKSEYHSLRGLDTFIREELTELPDDEDVYIPSKDITVWIDPLDATQEFTEHLHQYVTTMVCVAVNGVPKIGVIHKPFDKSASGKTGKTFWGWVPFATSRELNAYVENLPHVAPDSPNIIISRSHAGSIADKLKNIFINLNVTQAGGAGYKVLQLVKGDATVYLHTTKIKKWDICAGDAILRAVGGEMTTLTNKFINYTSENGEVNKEGILASVMSHDKYYEIFKGKLNPS